MNTSKRKMTNNDIERIVIDACERGDIKKLLQLLGLLPERAKINIIMLCAQKVLAQDVQIFWKIAKLLFPSYWFVKLMCLSIYNKKQTWRDFYEAALLAINQMVIGYKSFSYATLSQPIADIDGLETIKTIEKALNLLPFSYRSLAGGAAILICNVLPKVRSKVHYYAFILANIVSSLPKIDAVSKIDIISRLALMIKDVDLDAADEIARRLLRLLSRVDPQELVEVEITIAKVLFELYENRKDELLKLASDSSFGLDNILKITLMKMIKTSPVSEFDHEQQEDKGNIMGELKRTIERRDYLRRRLSEELDKILERR